MHRTPPDRQKSSSHASLGEHTRTAHAPYRILPGGIPVREGYKEELIDGQDYVKLESGTGNSDPFALISMTRIPIPGRLINDLRVSLDHADEIIRGLKSG